jgi:chemotaxis signal transduction protein
LFEDDIATIVQWRKPAPLPHAPQSVLGVVSIQGRMLTVLDLATLVGAQVRSTDKSHRHILALRGDEQLAVAVDALGKNISVSEADFDESQASAGLVLGVFKHEGTKTTILNIKELFPAAIHGRERRRRRF